MFYGVLATDIKKSSLNWNTFPRWMPRAVFETNERCKWVFDTFPLEDGTQFILPNSPEGDANYFFFESQNEHKLKEHIKQFALRLQFMMSLARNDVLTIENKKQHIEDKLNENTIFDLYSYYKDPPEFFGSIYIRIGIAVSHNKPYQYTFNALSSYRGGVVQRADEANERASYDKGYAMTTDNIQYENSDTLQYPNQLEELYKKEKWKSYEQSGQCSGMIVFIHYAFGITPGMTETNETFESCMSDEFDKYHNESTELIHRFGGTLVKIKSDGSSMYYINQTGKIVEFFEACNHLCSMLPKGSSIGISQGNDIHEIKYPRKDYFGKTVNIAARLHHNKWSYETPSGRSIENSFENRIAFGSDDDDTINTLQQKIDKPYTIDCIPKRVLNVGETGTFTVISRKIQKSNIYHKGVIVSWDNEKCIGTIEKINVSSVIVKTKDRQEIVPFDKIKIHRIMTDDMQKLIKNKHHGLRVMRF